MTTDELLTTDDILEAFGTAGRVLPRVALEQAVERWAEVAPVLVSMLEADADVAGRSKRTDDILFFAVYLVAECRETRAYRPLCAIAADGERLSELIEDGVTEDFPAILPRIYDGDPAPLRALIEASDAHVYSRGAGLWALAWLTASGRIDRDETAGYLRDLFTILQPEGPSYVWVAWQEAIARLGLEELAPLVETAFREEWVDPMWLDVADFWTDLRAAQQADDPLSVFDTYDPDGKLDDAAGHLSEWGYFRPDPPALPPRTAAPASAKITAPVGWGNPPVQNPYRNVGRNDPCPCGSGKKFKKCCLDKVR